ncbi:hypothetical protein P2318_08495 [Myxococcaceae bacterium GXIMD 01537]
MNRRFLLCWLLILPGLACVKRPVDYEREHARSLAPRQVEASATAAPEAPRRMLRVRVYADADYRRQVLRWEQGIGVQLRRASEVVQGSLGVAFELESVRPWERPSAGPELDTALKQLEVLDAGEDVDLVIGLVSALPVFSASQHELGKARMFGRHCVLRGMENPEEHLQLEALFKHLPDGERDALYRDRKLHKETSVLLHEWAHTLGAFHVRNTHWMMSAGYEPSQSAFAPQTLQLLGVSLRHVPDGRRGGEAQRAWARELKATLSSLSGPDWEGPERDSVSAFLDRVLAGEAVLTEEGPPPLSPEDRQRLDEVLALDRQGRVELAAQLLEPLAQRRLLDERVQVMACYLATRVSPKLPSTRERCEATAARFPQQPAPLMNLAVLHLNSGTPAEAQPYLLRVRQQLEARPAVDAAQWSDLASLFQSASCVTWAEQAAAKAPGAQGTDEVLAWAQRTRRWTGLPEDSTRSGVPVEREGDFVRATQEVQSLLEKGAAAQARTRLTRLSKDFPRASGTRVLQCELALVSGQPAPARALCREAVAAHDEAVQAHLYLAVIASRTAAGGDARKHLERVVDLAPEFTDAWRMLAEQYRAAGQTQPLQELRERYRARFSRELR